MKFYTFSGQVLHYSVVKFDLQYHKLPKVEITSSRNAIYNILIRRETARFSSDASVQTGTRKHVVTGCYFLNND